MKQSIPEDLMEIIEQIEQDGHENGSTGTF